MIERGSASETDVGNALAEQHGCDYVPWNVLGSLPSTAIAALPGKFAIRHTAVPVEVGEGFIRIALRDPANLRILDELFFVTGKKIVPAVAPEVRLYQALEKYYGERRTPRFAILAEKLSRPTVPSVIKKALPPPPDFSAVRQLLPGEFPPPAADPDGPLALRSWNIPDVPPVGWGGLPPPPEEVEEEAESIPWEEVPSVGSRPAAHEDRPRAASRPETSLWLEAPAPAPAPGSAFSSSASSAASGMPAAEDFAGILRATGRDEIFGGALAALSRRFRKSAIFAVKPDGVKGLCAAGERVDSEAVIALEIPWSEPSIFLNGRMSRSFYLGPLPPLPRHKGLASALGGWPAECLVQPVLMREKTVAFLYVECGGAQGATPADLTFVRELAGAAAAAQAASIRLRKKQVI